jgi:hypothetical protein
MKPVAPVIRTRLFSIEELQRTRAGWFAFRYQSPHFLKSRERLIDPWLRETSGLFVALFDECNGRRTFLTSDARVSSRTDRGKKIFDLYFEVILFL